MLRIAYDFIKISTDITMTNKPFFQTLFLSTMCLSSVTLFAADKSIKTDFPESIITSKIAKNGIKTAWYDEATTRYTHGVLGDEIEAGTLFAKTVEGKTVSLKLESAQVFEDIKPRLADIDNDGQNEIITIRSHSQKGAQIAVFGIQKASPNKLSLIASTPYIGQTNRWLAPVGIADFNNDGYMDIAYIDRPHLAKILRVWSYREGKLTQVAQKPGLTNHRIGDDYIIGGVKRCGNNPSMITVDSNWQRLIETSYKQGKLISQDIGRYAGRPNANTALRC